jgi:magnesium transporter
MIHVDVCRHGSVERDVPLERVPDLLRNGPDLVWVDAVDPTEEDFALLESQFGFHPLAMEDARKQNQRAKMDEYDGYLFITMRGAVARIEDMAEPAGAAQEIDIFLGPRYLVTLHRGDCTAISETRTRWEQRPGRMPEEPAFLLYVLFDTVVDGYFPVMDALDEAIDRVEDEAFLPDSVVDIGPALVLKRRLLLMRQALAPMRDLANSLLRADIDLIPDGTRVYYQDVYDHTLRLLEQVDLHRDILTGALEAQLAQISNRLNQVMKTLTSISAILMTMALISGIYGMNFRYMPELEWRYGYFGALGAMVLIGAGLTAFFRKIRWL